MIFYGLCDFEGPFPCPNPCRPPLGIPAVTDGGNGDPNSNSSPKGNHQRWQWRSTRQFLGKKVKKGDGGNMAVRCKQLIFNSFDIHLTIMIQIKINKAIETPHSKVDNPECRDPTSPKQHTLYI